VSGRLPRHLQGGPWRSRTGRVLHARLDAAADRALAADHDHGRAPRPGELERIMSYDRERRPRVLLLELEEATSGRGTTYWRGSRPSGSTPRSPSRDRGSPWRRPPPPPRHGCDENRQLRRAIVAEQGLSPWPFLSLPMP
jgi:hypothetical protein